MRIDAIATGQNPPHEVNVIIEVPVGGEPIKYEMDKEAGTLVVDRFLYTAMRYPGNYGFIPHTRSGDGDPCDVLIANTRPIVPGAVMAVRIRCLCEIHATSGHRIQPIERYGLSGLGPHGARASSRTPAVRACTDRTNAGPSTPATRRRR